MNKAISNLKATTIHAGHAASTRKGMSRLFRRLSKSGAFERIRVRMWSKWLLDAREGCTVIAFTSHSRREGVSTVVAGLARTIGATDPGRVLVLDVTPGLQANSGELVADLLEVQATPDWIQDISDFVTHNIFQGTDILSLKYIDLNRPTPQMMKALLDRLRINYHVILMDVGSLFHSDILPWLSASDYRILIIDASTATREVLEHQQRELEHMGITINGSILNKRTYPIPSFLYWLAR